MSLAAVDLQGGNEKTLMLRKNTATVPLRHLTGHFKPFTECPSTVKNEGVSVKSFSPIVFRIAVKGATEMNYRIETKNTFRIIEVSAPLDKENRK